jgi:hypothetical protein
MNRRKITGPRSARIERLINMIAPGGWNSHLSSVKAAATMAAKRSMEDCPIER